MMKKLEHVSPEKLSGAIGKEVVYGAAFVSAVGLAIVAGVFMVSAPVYAICFAGGSLVSSGIAVRSIWVSAGGYDELLPDLTRRRG